MAKRIKDKRVEDWIKLGAINPTSITTPSGIIDSIITDHIQFDIAATPIANTEGLLQWNSTDGTLDLGMDGGAITMQIGQELFTKVRNDTGATLTNGSVVYISGRTGIYPDVKLARADSDTTSKVLGVITEDIPNTGDKFGFATTMGYVRGIKTNYSGAGNWGTTWATGNILYVSKTVAGQLTNIEPSVPHHSDVVGTVGVVSANGSILITLDRHRTLEELTDVDGTPLAATGQFPVWNQVSGYFDFNYNINQYVPYTGASGNVDLGAHGITAMSGTFGTPASGNYSHFEADGTLVAYGNATTFKDELGDVTKLKIVGTGIQEDNVENGVVLQQSCAFATDYLYMNLQLNHDRKLGAKIYPHVHWFQAATGTPNFLVQYRYQKNGANKVTDWTNYIMKTSAYTYSGGVINQITHDSVGITPTSGDGPSDILQIRFTRDRINGSNAFTGTDNYNADATITSFDVHIEIDTLGSRQEYVK